MDEGWAPRKGGSARQTAQIIGSAPARASRGLRGITLIAPGEEAKRLGVLPVGTLLPSLEILETLGLSLTTPLRFGRAFQPIHDVTQVNASIHVSDSEGSSLSFAA